MITPRAGSDRRDRTLRVGLGIVALTLAALTLGSYASLRSERHRLGRWVDAAGAGPADLSDATDAETARLLAARAVLVNELGAVGPDTGDRKASGEHLAEAAEVAHGVLAGRPASWDAAMVTGAATYLGWSLTRDPRLFQEAPRWERPLATALRLGPGKSDPARFLAAAYLEIWPALSAQKRDVARHLLARVFSEPEGFNRLIRPWLDAAADRREALSLVPDDPEDWERLEAIYAERRDWEGFRAARERWDATLLSRLAADLAAAEARLAQGDLEGARADLLSVAIRARPDLRYAPLVAAAIASCPAGPVPRFAGSRLAPQLDFALDRCLLAKCPLPGETLRRLAVFSLETPAPLLAAAAAAAGDLPRAGQLVRRAETLEGDEWGQALLLLARAQAARGRGAEAVETLSRVPAGSRRGLAYWQVAADVARMAGDDERRGRAQAQMRGPSTEAWAADAWTFRGDDLARLETVTTAAAPGFSIDLADVPPDGAVIDIRLDGALVGTAAVAREGGVGGRALAISVPVHPGPHLLEVESAVGGRVRPGAVRLLR